LILISEWAFRSSGLCNCLLGQSSISRHLRRAWQRICRVREQQEPFALPSIETSACCTEAQTAAAYATGKPLAPLSRPLFAAPSPPHRRPAPDPRGHHRHPTTAHRANTAAPRAETLQVTLKDLHQGERLISSLAFSISSQSVYFSSPRSQPPPVRLPLPQGDEDSKKTFHIRHTYRCTDNNPTYVQTS